MVDRANSAPALLPVLLLVALAAGCTAVPGVGVEMRDDSPGKSWTEARLREVYGTPEWTAPAPDGGKMLHFRYKTAPSGADGKAVSVLTAVTTFGLITDAGSVEYRMLALVGDDGRLVCADRARINYAIIACPHEQRLALLDALPKAQRTTYRSMLIEVEPRRYAPGHYFVVREPALSEEAIADARRTGLEGGYATDPRYFFTVECYAYTRWYAEHLVARGRDPQAARTAGPRYATALYRAAGSRGETDANIARDLELFYTTLQAALDRGATNSGTAIARTCLDAAPDATSMQTLTRVDRALYQQVRNRAQLAQALTLRKVPEAPAPGGPWQLAPIAKPPYSLGMPNNTLKDPQHFTDMLIQSPEWRAALDAERDALRASVTIEALAEPVEVIERAITMGVADGQIPTRALLRRLIVALEARITIDDPEGAMKVLSAIARYYLAQPPGRYTLAKAGNTLAAASWIADRLGQHERAASIALMAGRVYLYGIEAILEDDNLASQQSRDNVREILNFVPYEYKVYGWDGSVTTYRMERPAFDAQGMLALMRDLRREFGPPTRQLGYAIPHFADPMTAAGIFENLAADAKDAFSSAGAAGFYGLARQSYEAAGADSRAVVVGLLEQANFVRSRSDSGRDTVKRLCEQRYVPARRAFANQFGNPGRKDIEKLFGAHLAGVTKDMDRRCRYK